MHSSIFLLADIFNLSFIILFSLAIDSTLHTWSNCNELALAGFYHSGMSYPVTGIASLYHYQNIFCVQVYPITGVGRGHYLSDTVMTY